MQDKITLYKAVENLNELLLEIDPETGELPEGYGHARDIVNQRAEATAAAILTIEARALQYKNRAAELAEQYKTMTRKTERLREYLRDAMAAAQMLRIEGADFTVRLYPERDAAAVIDDEAIIPREFIRVETVEKIDKRGILDALKNGENIQGAHLEYRDRLTLK